MKCKCYNGFWGCLDTCPLYIPGTDCKLIPYAQPTYPDKCCSQSVCGDSNAICITGDTRKDCSMTCKCDGGQWGCVDTCPPAIPGPGCTMVPRSNPQYPNCCPEVNCVAEDVVGHSGRRPGRRDAPSTAPPSGGVAVGPRSHPKSVGHLGSPCNANFAGCKGLLVCVATPGAVVQSDGSLAGTCQRPTEQQPTQTPPPPVKRLIPKVAYFGGQSQLPAGPVPHILPVEKRY